MKKNIAVFFGGRSCEHDISIISGVQVLNALDANKYNIVPVYMQKNGVWTTSKKMWDIGFFPKLGCARKVRIVRGGLFCGMRRCKIYAAVICCHGMGGEDGSLQGMLELCGIPYTSSGIMASAIGMDKIAMKMCFASAHLPVLPYTYVTREQFEKHKDVQELLQGHEYPLIVKPANLGSSIGIAVAHDDKSMQAALKTAFAFDTRVLIEKALTDFCEYNCAVLGSGQNALASDIEEPIGWQSFLTFEDKYIGKSKGHVGQKRKFPAEIDKELGKQITACALEAFAALNCKGVARIDFVYDKLTSKLYVNEINTIPGSLSYYLWGMKGISFRKLLDKLIDIALQDKQQKDSLVYAYESKGLFGQFASK